MDWDGERDLTADEAAEYILKEFRAAKNDEQVARYYYPDELIADYFLDYANEHYETLTAALNSAARAIKERGKE